MDIKTHKNIDKALCGTPVSVEAGRSEVRLVTTPVMAADDKGLVHGGFIFGLADYATMLAVNDPGVVLGGAEASFLKPVAVGESVVAKANVVEEAGRKRRVDVIVIRDATEIFRGSFLCFVLDKHALDV